MGIKDSRLFAKYARKAFDEIDIDKSGAVDYKEVSIGILYIYDSLNAKFPAHVLAPKRQEMMDLCRKYDKNGNGTIEFPEFLEMSKVLVGSRRNWRESLLWKYGSVMVLKVVICPLAAAFILKSLVNYHTPFADKVPPAPLASVLEMGIKYFSSSS